MRFLTIVFSWIVFSAAAFAQMDEICTEAGITPSLDSPFANVPYVFGKVILTGFDPSAMLSGHA